MNRTTTFAVLIGLALSCGVASAQRLVGESVSEFSGVQGGDSWFYGSYTPIADKDGVYGSSDFVPFDEADFTGTMWGRSGSVQIRSFGMNASGTNREVERWAVRRWESDVVGEVQLTGELQGTDRRNNGVIARIFVDGVEVYSQANARDFLVEYDMVVRVRRGSVIDFTLDADGSDLFDLSRYTAMITKLPCQAEFTGDDVLDVMDFLAFLMAWFQGDADFDGNGTTDALDLIMYNEVWMEEAMGGACR